MSWKFVFNTRNMPAGSPLEVCLMAAIKGNYKFMLFNGRVYYLHDNAALPTGIFVEDLI